MSRRALAGGAVAIALVMAACTGISHLRVIQPPSPGTAASGPAGTPLPPATRRLAVPRPARQLGVDIDLYTYPGQRFGPAAAADVAYAKRLHANSLSVSFPFFSHGGRSSRVYTRRATPAPGQLAVLARTAMNAGLYVSLRPLLSEGSLGQSRVRWRPPHLAEWFASYQRFLLPYAAMAQRNHIPELYVGAEFGGFSSSPRWNALDRALRAVFKGTLAYANNGMMIHPHAGGRRTLVTVDSYPALAGMTPGATVGQLTQAWRAYDRHLPPGVVQSEVGIDAVPGAYLRPFVHHWPTSQVDPAIQARWFSAACRAAVAEHLGGIYFWAIGFGQAELATPLSAKNQGAWSAAAGARAIAACFERANGD